MDEQEDAVQMRNEGSARTTRAKRIHRRTFCRHARAEYTTIRLHNELSLREQEHRLLEQTINHDISNQLTALQMLLELSELEDTIPQRKDYIREAQKIAQTIQWQLRFMREFQEACVNGLTWQLLESVIREILDQVSLPNITVDCRLSRIMISSTTPFKCVFYNLIVNSVMHGERVSVITLHTQETEHELTIVYEDDGCGISTLEKEKIFLKGYGRNTGLGLYLIREILRINGMTIHEDGEPGCGARFVIRVPRGLYRMRGAPVGEGMVSPRDLPLSGR